MAESVSRTTNSAALEIDRLDVNELADEVGNLQRLQGIGLGVVDTEGSALGHIHHGARCDGLNAGHVSSSGRKPHTTGRNRSHRAVLTVVDGKAASLGTGSGSNKQLTVRAQRDAVVIAVVDGD